MTPAELDEILDTMAKGAAGEPSLMPGLITIRTDDWVGELRDFRATCTALSDGMRHRDIQIQLPEISS